MVGLPHLDLDPEPVEGAPQPAIVVAQHLQLPELLRAWKDRFVRGDLRIDEWHRRLVRTAGADGIRELGGRPALEPEIDELIGEIRALARFVHHQVVEREYRPLLRDRKPDRELAARVARVLLRGKEVVRIAMREPD